MIENEKGPELLRLTVAIVSAHVAKNAVAMADLPALIKTVHSTLSGLGEASAEPMVEVKERPAPAVSIRKSVTDDYLICLEDGRKLKMLKRHLQTAYGMTPDDYRQRWGLPPDYPMVAPNYAERRSALAKQIGLGSKANRGSS